MIEKQTEIQRLLSFVMFALLLPSPLPAQAQDAFSSQPSASTSNGRMYISEVEKHISAHWRPPAERKWADLTVIFKIGTRGAASEIKASHSSGFPDVDKLALLCVQRGAPYPALPKGLSQAQFEIHFESKCPPSDLTHSTTASVGDTIVAPLKVASKSDSKPGKSAQDNEAVDFGHYIANVQRRIKRAWHPLETAEPKDVHVSFKIDKDGQISGQRVQSSSGDDAVDSTDLAAVTAGAPFGRLPEGACNSVDLDFWFQHAGRLGFVKSGDAWVGYVGRD